MCLQIKKNIKMFNCLIFLFNLLNIYKNFVKIYF